MAVRINRITASVAVALAAAAAVIGCKSVDDDRIPIRPVSIGFTTVAAWNIYGVSGAMQWTEFIREEHKPANYFYTDRTYTGYGGVLLVCDPLGNPLAYDLSCPVERRTDVRVRINPDDEYLAECPMCHSKYNVFSNFGAPVSGEAASKVYGLRRYNAGPGRGGEYMVITF